MSKKKEKIDKDPKFVSLHADPNMVWEDTSICHNCLNRLNEGSCCDVFDDVDDVNDAFESNKCEFFIDKNWKD